MAPSSDTTHRSTSKVYTKLDPNSDQIRLLRLFPPRTRSNPDFYKTRDMIQCDLFVVSRSTCPRYEAVSYMWGEDPPSRKMLINGEQVPVRMNLDLALRRIRQDGERLLWVDALCINQEDIEERNHQVRRMGDIYSNASQVLCWTADSSIVDCWSKLTNEPKILPISHPYWKEMLFLIEREGPSLFVASASTRKEQKSKLFSLMLWQLEPLVSSMVHFCQSPYWNRLWIVQEIVLAKDIKIYDGSNNESISWKGWSSLMKLMNSFFLREHAHKFHDADGTIRSIYRQVVYCSMAAIFIHLRADYGRKWRLSDLLTFTDRSRCSDPRDRVYGLLGLLDLEGGDPIADYSKTVLEVYWDFMSYEFKLYKLSVATLSRLVLVSADLQKALGIAEDTHAGEDTETFNITIWPESCDSQPIFPAIASENSIMFKVVAWGLDSPQQSVSRDYGQQAFERKIFDVGSLENSFPGCKDVHGYLSCPVTYFTSERFHIQRGDILLCSDELLPGFILRPQNDCSAEVIRVHCDVTSDSVHGEMQQRVSISFGMIRYLTASPIRPWPLLSVEQDIIYLVKRPKPYRPRPA